MKALIAWPCGEVRVRTVFVSTAAAKLPPGKPMNVTVARCDGSTVTRISAASRGPRYFSLTVLT